MRSLVSRLERDCRRDIVCGVFFTGIALIGFFDVQTNARLMASLGRGPDPGPALLPLVVLTLVSLGGGLILLKGVAGWALTLRAANDHTPPRDETRFGRHTHAAALLASLVVLPSLVTGLGFLTAAGLFAAPWLVWLEYRRSHNRRRALLFGVIAAALLALSLHLIFITLLGVAL